jgi:hypothetical protein
MATSYWFARRFPVGDPRDSMAPVSPEGRRIVWTFLAAMVVGALSALLLSLVGMWVPGLVVFAAAAMAGGGYFIAMSVRHGDKQHTVAEYRSGKFSGSGGTT